MYDIGAEAELSRRQGDKRGEGAGKGRAQGMGEKGLKANMPVWKWLQITQYDKIASFLGQQ